MVVIARPAADLRPQSERQGIDRVSLKSKNVSDTANISHAFIADDTLNSGSSLTASLLDDSLSAVGNISQGNIPDPSTSDSIPADRSHVSRLNLNPDHNDLSASVEFSAKDSLVMIGTNNAFLYGDGQVEYEEFKLNAAKIEMNLDSATVAAQGMPDSLGQLSGNPVFAEKGTTYESETMRYNFKTERGIITNIITEQGEGFLTGGRTKKNADGSYYIENGRYTTCDDHEHPHFYFNITRGKMRPKKDVVTGPAYMVLADVPLPLALPFGYFPFSKDYSSGIIFPSFGDDYNRGFYMRDGGYYFAINDNVDLALRGEIYTKGSWGISAYSTYVKRYRFRGNF
ncbi:MAG: hypothetical protein K2J15_03140, partial [Muribaculaceae bacterium]|nr:hypothetical protein [Muribaculaceae bacterium]